MLNKIIIIIVLLFMIVGGSYWAGFNKGSRDSQDTPSIIDTITYIDTTYHTISDTSVIESIVVDTVIYVDSTNMPINIDSAQIIKEYYAIHSYKKEWKDTTIQVFLEYDLSQNKMFNSNFNYKLLKPFQTIVNPPVINTKSYKRYISAKINYNLMRPTETVFGIEYTGNKFGYGVGYQPAYKSYTISFKYHLFRF